MNTLPWVELLVFFAFFMLSFYAISCIRFEKICKVSNPAKVHLLMFLLSLVMAYLSARAVLSLSLYNGL